VILRRVMLLLVGALLLAFWYIWLSVRNFYGGQLHLGGWDGNTISLSYLFYLYALPMIGIFCLFKAIWPKKKKIDAQD
jgi:uncharacterized BrkB/YihY/UPF0761 family membrane protein